MPSPKLPQSSLSDLDHPHVATPPLAGRMTAKGRDSFVQGYVALMRGARRVARSTGAIAALDRRRDRPGPLFLRSLFAVHDIDDLIGLDLPWWTFAATRRADAFLAARGGAARAFEYGAGASTLWLSRRCAQVVTTEHDHDWWHIIAPHLHTAGNVEAHHIPPVPARDPQVAAQRAGWDGLDFSAYAETVQRYSDPFDLIVIDGRARAACLSHALDRLAPGGLIVFDNSNRRRYAAAIAATGLRVERFGGFAPTVPWPSETALLSRGPLPPGSA